MKRALSLEGMPNMVDLLAEARRKGGNRTLRDMLRAVRGDQ